MAVTNTTPLLGFALPTTGDLSGTWGDTVNNSITSLTDSAIAGTTTLSTDADVTLTSTTLAANQARQAILLWNAANSVTRNITAPAQSKSYIVINASTGGGSIVIRGVGPTAGVTIAPGFRALVVWNGSDFVEASLGSALAVSRGGTGQTSYTDGQLLIGNSVGNTLTKASLTAGSGVSITPGNGSITISSTAAGTVTGVTATSPIVSSGGNAPNISFLAASTLGNILTSNGSIWTSAALGTYATTWPTTQTFNGSSSTFASVLANAAETTTVSASPVTGTVNFYINSQSIFFSTANASGNWTLNVAFSSGTSLNSALAVGQTVTLTFLVTNGVSAYYQTAFTIDGTSVTPKWQGGATPAFGNTGSIDVYTYTILKTGSAIYTVLASQTKFA